jgi:hypothetical protein
VPVGPAQLPLLSASVPARRPRRGTVRARGQGRDLARRGGA